VEDEMSDRWTEGTGLHTVPPVVPPPRWWTWQHRADGTWQLRYEGESLCSEAEWQTIEGLSGMPTPDQALRAAIEEAFTDYVGEIRPPAKPYPVVPSAAMTRAITQPLASGLGALAGLPALTPRTDETFAARVVVRHVVRAALGPEDAQRFFEDTERSVEAAEKFFETPRSFEETERFEAAQRVADAESFTEAERFEDALRGVIDHAGAVAASAARLGAEVHDPPGPASERDALVRLCERVVPLLEQRCPGATMLRFREVRHDDGSWTVEYSGLLYDVVRVIQLKLPASPGSIAELTPAALYSALQRACPPDHKS
jgi:hypothetical protein